MERGNFISALLFQEGPNHLILLLRIRLIAHRQVKPCILLHDALLMAEGLKALLSVIRAHTAVSHSAKAHGRGRQMNDRVINAAPSEGGAPQKHLLYTFILCENIKGKRLGTSIHKGQRFVHRPNGQDRQQRPENLFLHYRILRRHTIQNGRRYLQSLLAAFSSENQLALIYQAKQAVEMLPVYNFSIIRILQRLSSVHVRNFFFDIFQKPFLYLLMYQYIIRRYAGLAAVQIFSKRQASGRQLQICALVDDAGTFSSQLQGHRRQMGAGLFHHQLSHVHTARKEDIIKPLGEQYGTPHGLANAVLLPIVLRMYGSSCEKKLARLARNSGVVDEALGDAETAALFIDWIQEMNDSMGIPRRLAGIEQSDIRTMAKHADKEGNPLYPVPKLMNRKELEEIYYAVKE